MFKRIQNSKYSVNAQAAEKSHHRIKTEGSHQARPDREKSYQKTSARNVTFNLQPIHQQQEENIDESILLSRVEQYQKRSKFDGASSRSSRTRATRATSSSSKAIDQRTSALKSKLEDKIMQAQLKMQELKLGLKRHQKIKTDIIQRGEEKRISRSREKRL